MTVSSLKSDLNLQGYSLLRPGVVLQDELSVVEDQLNWPSNHALKDFDFSTCPYWVLNDAEFSPIGFDSLIHIVKIFGGEV